MFKRSLASLAVVVMSATTSAAQDADTVVATVNGVDITFGHVVVLRSRLPEQYNQLPPETLYEGIVDQLIQQQALVDADAPLSRASKLVLENEERALLANESLLLGTQDAVTDEAIADLYEETVGSAEAEPEFNASHILVETEEEALAIVEDLNGGADFAELAREKSTGPSGPEGGLLGWFGAGAMVPEFEEAVVALEDGAVSAPVQTQFGWHVIKRNESRDKPKPTLEEMTLQLRGQLEQLAVQAAVDAAMESAEVMRNDTAEFDLGKLNDASILE